MTIESRLAEIRARVDAATEGPWEAGPREGGLAEVNTAPAHAAWMTDTTRPVIYEVVNQALRADAEFIAHARADVPALLAAVQAVMKLHAPIERRDGPVCDHCLHSPRVGSYPYPCPTVQAITAALEVEG